VTFEHAARRLIELARANHGTVTAVQVEADQELALEPKLVSAAARALAGGTNALSTVDDQDGRAWFPYTTLTFSELHGKGSGRRAAM
jgi:hypothetical protein